MTRSAVQFWKNERGVTAIEFGIIAPLMLIVSLGIVETGRFFWIRTDMTQQVDQAERKIMIKGKIWGTSTAYTNARLKSDFEAAYPGSTFSYAFGSDSAGDYTDITVTRNVPLLIPFVAPTWPVTVVRRARGKIS
jgi:Flp pilus assembly protein TadG